MARDIETDVVVVGAGIAGCASALALRREGLRVVLVEKASGQPHRFCGEFVSGEALGFLSTLGVSEDVAKLGPNRVQRMALYPMNGAPFGMDLGNEGFGLSRRSLDAAILGQAVHLGVEYIEGTSVEGITGDPRSGYAALTRDKQGNRPTIRARAAVGAHGKRSALDRLLGRRFVNHGSPFVGVKCHYQGTDRGRDVELYLFPGGYCGFVGIEGGRTNLCMLATQRSLEANGGRPEGLIEAARKGNLHLAGWFGQTQAVADTLMVISQIPFVTKEQVVNGVFMVGDSAGLPAPFLGLGVATGLCSAIQCAEIMAGWLHGRNSFDTACSDYETWWRTQFAGTHKWGHRISQLLCRPLAGELALRALHGFPSIGEKIYRRSRAGSGPKQEWAGAER